MPVARLTMTGQNITVTVFLPVTANGRFSPPSFSLPWPRAFGTWDGNEYTAEIDCFDDPCGLEFAWNDGEVTSAQLPDGISLLVPHDLRLETTRMKKAYQVRLSAAELL